MPQPRKPRAFKVLDGSREPDIPIIELPLLDDTPEAPDWLPNAHAVKEWDRLAPILHRAKLLTSAGVSTLAQLCALHGKIVQLYAAGECPNASMVAQYRGLANDFGLTPVAQGKVRPSGETGESSNKFAKHRKQPA